MWPTNGGRELNRRVGARSSNVVLNKLPSGTVTLVMDLTSLGLKRLTTWPEGVRRSMVRKLLGLGWTILTVAVTSRTTWSLARPETLMSDNAGRAPRGRFW